jgi:hypothetical protein
MTMPTAGLACLSRLVTSRPDLAVQSQGSFTIPGLPHDLYFGIVCQQLPHPDADEFVIVDDQDPDHDAPSFREPHPRLARIRSS